jgi:exonuclease III
MEGTNFHLLSININGLDKEKLNKLTSLDNFDIMFIQETHNAFDGDFKEQTERKMDCIVLTNDSQNHKKGGVGCNIN